MSDPDDRGSSWTLLAGHGHVMVEIARDPGLGSGTSAPPLALPSAPSKAVCRTAPCSSTCRTATSLAPPRTGATITPADRDPGCASRTPAATVPGRRQPVLAAFDFAYYGNAISSPMIIKLISPHASLVGATTVTLAVFAVAALPG
jgi:hypothetical protein